VKKNLIMIGMATLIGCGGQTESNEKVEVKIVAKSEAVTPEAVVWVNETPITSESLAEAIERTLGNHVVLTDAGVEAKVLDSLVVSRLMALEAEKTLPTDVIATIEQKAQTFREELLVKAYINANITPQPATPEQINTYYQTHLKEFGGGTLKTFEYLSSIGSLSDTKKDALIHALSSIKGNTDWKAAIAQLKAQKLPIRYQKTTVKTDLLPKELANLIDTTEKGQVSPIAGGETLYLVRVLDEKPLPARSLAEVRSEIQQRLAPHAMREAIKETVVGLKANAEIRYSK